MNLQLAMTYSKSSNRPTSVVINVLKPYKTNCYYVSTKTKPATYSKETFFFLDFLIKYVCQKALLMGKTLPLLKYDKNSKNCEVAVLQLNTLHWSTPNLLFKFF